ncbi:hypothetical protein BSU01_16370 [Erwinia billingiae]|jgi:hypothetical protein|nr:hypothetical protein [Erwinia billingiae]
MSLKRVGISSRVMQVNCLLQFSLAVFLSSAIFASANCSEKGITAALNYVTDTLLFLMWPA